ncbi:MAG: ATP-binding protein [Gemmatimonadota bacterium]
MKLDLPASNRALSLRGILRLNYLGRLAVAGGILLAALIGWGTAPPDQTFAAAMIFLGAVAFTAWSYRVTHTQGVEPTVSFRLAQSLFDVLLTTSVIHLTGGAQSPFTPVFILVLTAAALMLPAWGQLVVWASTTTLFAGDVAWAHPDTFRGSTLVLLALFALVSLVTGWLGAGLRRAGMTLGAVESELRQLRLDTGDILANLSTGLLTVDGRGRLAYINQAAEKLLGLDASIWLGQRVLDEVDRVAPGMAEVIRGSGQTRRPVLRRKLEARIGGEAAVFGVSTAVLIGDGTGQPSVTAIFQDITDAERMEGLKIRAERLQAVAELSASLAHEIKNPLASIRSSVEQISKPTLSPDDRALLQNLVLTESDRLSRLLSEFLEFARIRSERIEDVDLPELVGAALRLAEQHPDAPAGVELQGEGLGRELRIRGDADLLHRAVFNLVLNALQFAGENGTVRVTVEGPLGDEDPRALGIPGSVRISVEDSGPGVAEGDLGRVFEPFFTTRKGGSGLGLAVVHRAMDAHQGNVWVERGALGGARFVMVLPAHGERGA